MRFALVIPAALAVLISGCAFPRVVAGANSPAFYARCEVEGAPPEGSMLFATVRLPDCSGPLLKMTDVRSSETLYGARSTDGQAVVESIASSGARITPGACKIAPIVISPGASNSFCNARIAS